MSNLNQFVGEPAVKSIVNHNAGAVTPYYVVPIDPVVRALSGALTANTLATALSITGGGGYLEFSGVSAVDTTSRTMRIVVTIDGVIVFDRTTSANTVATKGLLAVGAVIGTAAATGNILERRRFNSSCKVEIASSLTETDKLNFFSAYSLT